MALRSHRTGATVLATLAALGAGAVAAVGQGAPRQTATAVFDQTRPGSATGARLEIHYRDPEDPAAKPPAVSLIVINLPAGTAIDTSAPASCEASDAELMAQGPSACPPDSRVGGGRVTLDTGLAGDGRMPSGPTTLLNAADELIMLVELDGSARAVARARIEGSRLTTEVPPVPGGPADGFTAIRDVDLKVDQVVSTSGARYLTTPPSCPPGRSFAGNFEFTFRDGVTQTVPSSSPCAPPRPAARDRAAPRIAVRGVPRRRCVSRGFRARITIRDASRLRRAGVRLDGRVLRRTTRKRLRVPIRARRLSAGRHRVTVTVRDRVGNRARRTVRFRRCGR